MHAPQSTKKTGEQDKNAPTKNSAKPASPEKSSTRPSSPGSTSPVTLESAKASHDYPGALQLVNKALKLNTNDSALKLKRAQILLRLGKVNEALNEMEAVAKTSQRAEDHFTLGLAYKQDEQTFKAYKAFKRAVALSPRHAGSWLELGELALSRLQTATETQKKVIEQELEATEKALSSLGEDTPELIILKAHRLMASGKYDEAFSLVKAAAKKNSKPAAYHRLMAANAVRDGQLTTARDHLKAALERDPEHIDSWIFLAQLHTQDTLHQEALTNLKKANRIAPFNSDVLVQMALTYAALEQIDDVVKVAERLNTHFPEQVEGALLLSSIAIQKGEYAQAIAVAGKALRRHPTNKELYVLLYASYTATNKNDDAANILKQLLKIEPESRIYLVQNLLDLGQIPAAVKLMEDEFKDHPQRIDVAVNLWLIYMQLNQVEKAKAVKKLALTKAEDRDEALKIFDAVQASLTAPPERGATP